MTRTLTAAIAALALMSCSGQAATSTARPALWKVADKDTTIYLFGTIHLLPKDLQWIGPKLQQAMASSHGLILETVLDRNPQAMAGLMLKIAVSPNLPPVLERVPADKRPALERLAKDAGVPLAALDRYETWAVALTLASAGYKDLGVSQSHGAEEVLRKSFEDAGKSVRGFETPGQQLGYFDGLPEDAQRAFLLGVLEDKTNIKAEFDKMIAAWGKGDVAAIAATFDDEFKTSKALTDALLKRRNLTWTDALAKRMGPPGTVFVAVGAGHLAGPDSVATLLRKRGFAVSRLQ